MAFGGHFFAQSAYRFIQGVYFIHFIDSPSPTLTMPAHYWVAVAIYTKGYARVLETLFVVVGFAWP